MLIVLDANGMAPDEGFVLLATSSGMSTPNSPLSWEFSEDTLHWDPATGQVSLPSFIPTNAWCCIQSPDPVLADRWRTSWRKVVDADTVRLAVSVPYELQARLLRTLGGVPSHYSVECTSALDGTVRLESWEQQAGSIRKNGHTTVSSFPLHVALLRFNPINGEERIVGQTEVEFQGEETAIVAHWSDSDQLAKRH